MTLTNPKVVTQALKNNGMLEDMQMARIYQYKSAMDGKIQFALFNDHRFDDMAGSPYVEEVVLLFDNPDLTEEGEAFIKEQASGKR